MEEMSGQPVELSYRAIGSSKGKVEFLVSHAPLCARKLFFASWRLPHAALKQR